MGEKIDLLSGILYFKNKNDEYERVGNIVDVEELDANTDFQKETESIYPSFKDLNSVTFECEYHRKSVKNLEKFLVYGWKVKGPVRKRVLLNKLKLYER